jgi:acyl carrier protein
MDNSQILQELNEIFRDVLNNPTLVLTPELTAADVKDWDSFNHINIVVATEARFGVKFRTAELEQLKNVGEFASLIEQKLGKKR